MSIATPVKKPSANDFASEQDVRWCPGCGDYAILAQMKKVLANLGIPKEKLVFISGIGCSSRFPYYLDTYGMHSIHGRAPAIATGLSVSRPDLSVWVVTGDGDALSIGGNHLIHAMRRNVNLKILLFNNRIYGLTKGQYSPTSEEGKITKSTPFGSLDHPFNPVSVALGVECTFVARTVDSDRKHLTDTLRAAAAHEGTAIVEILQNCDIFNDGAWAPLKDAETRDENLIRLEHGKPILVGESRGVFRDALGEFFIDEVTDDNASKVVIHDAQFDDPSAAFQLSRLSDPVRLTNTPIGVFRNVTRPVFDRQMQTQIDEVTRRMGKGDFNRLLRSADTWDIA